MNMNRKWFRVWSGTRSSDVAHSFAVTFESPDDGIPLAACRLDPHELFTSGQMLEYEAAKDEYPRCEGCEKALEENKDNDD